jgi:hypothetical protein
MPHVLRSSSGEVQNPITARAVITDIEMTEAAAVPSVVDAPPTATDDVILGNGSSEEVQNPITSPTATGIEMTDAKAPAVISGIVADGDDDDGSSSSSSGSDATTNLKRFSGSEKESSEEESEEETGVKSSDIEMTGADEAGVNSSDIEMSESIPLGHRDPRFSHRGPSRESRRLLEPFLLWTPFQ